MHTRTRTRTSRPSTTRLLGVGLGVALLSVAACGDDDEETTPATTEAGSSATSAAPGGGDVSITVGSANFPESVLLAEIYGGALRAAGIDVTLNTNIGSRDVYYAAIESGEIDLLPEYTGSLLGFVSEGAEAKDVTEQVTALGAALPPNLEVLEPSSAEDKDVIVCNAETAEQYSLTALSDLEEAGPNITLGGPPEFAERTVFGVPAFAAVGITFKEFRPLEIGPPLVDALRQNAVNCANLFSTDAAIGGDEFVSLDDDLSLVAAEAVIPLINSEVATPEVTEVLNSVSSTLDTDQLKALNVEVQTEARAESEVAAEWLQENDLGG